MTLPAASWAGLRRFVEAGSCRTKSAMSGSEEVKEYSAVSRCAQLACRHGAGGKLVYGSAPVGLGDPSAAETGPHRSPPSGRRPSPWKSAGRERRSSVPSTAASESPWTSGWKRAVTGARFVAGSRCPAATETRR